MELIDKFKKLLEFNTSEQLFGITPQLPEQCGNIDSIIGTLNKVYKNIQWHVKTLNNIDEVNEIASVAKDLDWDSSDMLLDKELETLRNNIQVLRMWGQEWKDLAKEILSNENNEELLIKYLGSNAITKYKNSKTETILNT